MYAKTFLTFIDQGRLVIREPTLLTAANCAMAQACLTITCLFETPMAFSIV